jgi:predicted RNase H-like HicB family nuclease
MKEYKKLLDFCLRLGLQLIMVNKNGQFGDKDVPHSNFTDSNPHAKRVGQTCYKQAAAVANAINEAKKRPIIEPFIAAPVVYPEELNFWAVHRTYQDGFHEIFVPDVGNAIGTGESYDEAFLEVWVKLHHEIEQLQAAGEQINISGSESIVKDTENTISAEVTNLQSCKLVNIKINLSSPPPFTAPTKEEHAELETLVQRAMQEVVSGNMD